MAEQDIDDLIATTDGDTTWGDDLRGAIATLGSTRGQSQVTRSGLSVARVNSFGTHFLTVGPWANAGNTAAMIPGLYTLGLVDVRGGTPDEVSVRVVTGAVTSNVYYCLYDLDADGMPGNLANSWGPFDATVAANVTLTSQSQTIVAGQYWAGILTPDGNGGNVTLYGARPCYAAMVRPGFEDRNVFWADLSDATPRAAMTGTMRTSNTFDSVAANVAFLMGEDN